MSHSASAGLRRVVVTGVGLVSPVGVGTEETWQGILAGRSGIAPITLFDAAGHAARFAGEVKGLRPVAGGSTARTSRSAAASSSSPSPRPTWRSTASGLEVEPAQRRARRRRSSAAASADSRSSSASTGCCSRTGPDRVSPFFILSSIVNLAAGQVSVRLGAKGPNSAVATACTTGRARHRRRVPAGPARLRRRDGLRRHRGQHHAAGYRRLRRHARALDAQRRARTRQPSVGRRSRRLRRRRRCGHPGARGARACRSARRADPRRARRLRHERRRAPSDRAARRRRRRRAG